MESLDVDLLLDRLTASLRQRLARRGAEAPYLVGILRGGAWVAARLHAALWLSTPIGTLDIGFHRDDFASAGLQPVVGESRLPWDVADRHVVLVDDVLYTGRTVRAAINEIFDWGRPASVTLAVLVSRDGRELPFQADAVGAEIALAAGQQLKLRGPEPLRLELVEAVR